MAEFKRDESEIGALWAKEGGKGPYLTGEINGVKVVCFPAKPSEKGPAWRVLKSKPRDEATPTTGRPVDSSDIPFAWLLPLVLPMLAAAGVALA